ncbi:MAG: flagellar export chaperone FliS [Vulcanibacillus sp.]
MSVNKPYETYKQNSVTTVSPGELTLMLYNGCIKFMNQAEQAILDKDIENKNVNLIKAQRIINELMVTLNMDYEISQSLLKMYDYIYRRLLEANVKNDIEILSEARGYVIQYRDSWKEAIQNNRQLQYGNVR